LELNIESQVVLDPVYLLTSKEWSNFAEQTRTSDQYILLYAFNCNQETVDYAKLLAKRKKCKLYVIDTMIKDLRLGGKHFWNVSPEVFVGLFRDAQEVVTNSFHGLSFSIIFEKPVHVFAKATGGNSRLFDIMRELNVENARDRLEIDYSTAQMKLEEKRNLAMKFIRNEIIGDCYE